jgi:hypothetical protein
MTFQNTVDTSQKTSYISITNTKQLRLFKEIAAVYSKNHEETFYSVCKMQFFHDKVGGTCNHGVLKE